ncbi:MAG: DNA-formamidopyrimidine glycosylase family protein [Armatimonadota bacterium]|nr:DNA-formamidopyrimidine glycosylase family protein [Armatimonadota bacterium]
MPELPDVEGFRQYLYSTSLHQTITGVEARDSMVLLGGVAESDLRDALVGGTLRDTHRHGKWLFADVQPGPWLCLHFGMTGHLVYFKHLAHDPEHDRMLISFENGFHLAYDCQRRLGRISLAESVEGFVEEQDLGPDAARVDWEGFLKAVNGRDAMLKSAFLDQSMLAGIGNILADEINFQVGLHPRATLGDLDERLLRELYDAMRLVVEVTTEARTAGGEIPGDWLMHDREESGDCPRCEGTIQRIIVGSRSTYFCPGCQGLPG